MMVMKKIILISISIIVLCIFAYLTIFSNQPVVEELTFDESRWDVALIAQIEASPRYLSRDLPIDIPPAPLSSSSETAEEIAYVRMLEEQRTPEQEDLINSQIDDFKSFFLEQAGINPTTKPLTILLMKETMNEAGFFILREKWRFQRARPYDVDPTLAISIAPPPHSSYPSGHGGQSWAAAFLLTRLDPYREDLWLDTARSIGHNREIAGVHFPSDTLAGQLLSDQVLKALFENAEFMKKFEEVRAREWPVR
jgi:acid phosphatase (class A)